MVIKHFFITPLQSKMQTDQDEQGQGDGQKETEEKTQRENEEMEVRFCNTELLVS